MLEAQQQLLAAQSAEHACRRLGRAPPQPAQLLHWPWPMLAVPSAAARHMQTGWQARLVGDGGVVLCQGRALALPANGAPKGSGHQQQRLAGRLARQEEHQALEHAGADVGLIQRLPRRPCRWIRRVCWVRSVCGADSRCGSCWGRSATCCRQRRSSQLRCALALRICCSVGLCVFIRAVLIRLAKRPWQPACAHSAACLRQTLDPLWQRTELVSTQRWHALCGCGSVSQERLRLCCQGGPETQPTGQTCSGRQSGCTSLVQQLGLAVPRPCWSGAQHSRPAQQCSPA